MAHLIHRTEARTIAQPVGDPVAVESAVEQPSLTNVVGEILVVGTAAVFLIVGALALARAGLDGDMSTPVVNVLGYTHTAWLGLAEVGVGLLLLLSGISRGSRDLAVALGVLLIVAGIVVRMDTTAMPSELAMQHSYGWFLIGTGIVATVGGLMPTGWTRRWQRSIR
jgi:hypothetical protein